MALHIRLPHELQQQAHVVARRIHGTRLTSLILRMLRREIAEARKARPSLFEQVPLAEMKPIDRTIYDLLTREGRRTPDDLIADTGCPRSTVKESLKRLVAAGYVGTLPQGQATPGQPGAQKILYVSLQEE